MYQSVTVSAISLKPIKWDKASNAEKLEALFVEAAKNTPQLILATEGVLEGYVVMDVIEGRATPEAMLEIAEPLDGDIYPPIPSVGTTTQNLSLFWVRPTVWDLFRL